MFISRRKFEKALEEAEQKGRYEAEKECWQQYRLRDMQDKIEELGREVALLKGPTEGSTGDSKPCEPCIN